MQTLTPRTVTRQRLYQLRKKAEGKCVVCGNPRSKVNATYCEHHRELVRARNKTRRASTQALLSDDFPEKLWSNALDNFIR